MVMKLGQERRISFARIICVGRKEGFSRYHSVSSVSSSTVRVFPGGGGGVGDGGGAVGVHGVRGGRGRFPMLACYAGFPTMLNSDTVSRYLPASLHESFQPELHRLVAVSLTHILTGGKLADCPRLLGEFPSRLCGVISIVEVAVC